MFAFQRNLASASSEKFTQNIKVNDNPRIYIYASLIDGDTF